MCVQYYTCSLSFMCIAITSFTDKPTDESKQDNNSTDSTKRSAPVIVTCVAYF